MRNIDYYIDYYFLFEFVLKVFMFGSCYSSDGSYFHKVGAEYLKAIPVKSGEWSISLFLDISILLLVCIKVS